MWTLCKVDPRDLLHPLHCTLWTPWGYIGGLAKEFPTAAPGASLMPIGEAAIRPEPLEAAGHYRQQEASDTCVRVERQGVETSVLTPVAIGKAAPPVTHVKEPVVRDGDARRRAADIV